MYKITESDGNTANGRVTRRTAGNTSDIMITRVHFAQTIPWFTCIDSPHGFSGGLY